MPHPDAACGIGVNMLVAIVTVHSAFGLFMYWTGEQHGESFESHLLVLAIVAFLMLRGAGALSVDRALTRVAPSNKAPARLVHA
jgi:putative oxidoreductase